MNEFVPSRYSENVKRLALGLEPIDFGLRLRIGHPIEVTPDAEPLGLPRSPIDRHRSRLYTLLYDSRLKSPVDLRFSDAARRIVPRRLRFPILAQSAAELLPPRYRVWRPVLFPGAAYCVSACATGVRGRVLRGSKPMRWARVEARLPGATAVVGRAHGDDCGEFLLLIGYEAGPIGEIKPPLKIEVTVPAPAVPPAPPDPDRPKIDPLWDLPLEQAAAPGDPDPVSAGEAQPADYIVGATQTLDLDFGKIACGATFNIT